MYKMFSYYARQWLYSQDSFWLFFSEIKAIFLNFDKVHVTNQILSKGKTTKGLQQRKLRRLLNVQLKQIFFLQQSKQTSDTILKVQQWAAPINIGVKVKSEERQNED